MPALLTEELWDAVRPLLPAHPASPKGGRPRVSDRQCLTGLVFVLKTGLAWRFLPLELNCGSSTTVWRRLQEWTAAGVWPVVHQRLLEDLGEAGELHLDDFVIDSASVRAQKRGSTPDRTQQIAVNPAANGT